MEEKSLPVEPEEPEVELEIHVPMEEDFIKEPDGALTPLVDTLDPAQNGLRLPSAQVKAAPVPGNSGSDRVRERSLPRAYRQRDRSPVRNRRRRSRTPSRRPQRDKGRHSRSPRRRESRESRQSFGSESL